MPRHRGNSGHPQNSLPAFAPRRAVRRTIGRSHFGQLGIGTVVSSASELMSTASVSASEGTTAAQCATKAPIATFVARATTEADSSRAALALIVHENC